VTAARRGPTVALLSVSLMLAAILLAGGAVAAETDHAAVERADTAAAEAEGEAHGEGAEHTPEIHGRSLGLQLLNFGVLLGLLVLLGGKAINRSLAARHEQLKSELAAAATARAAAEESLRKQDERLKGLEKEIADLRAGIKKEAEVEKTRLVAAAEERARRLVDEATFVIEQQTKEGEATLRREAAEAGVRIAEQLLRQSFNAGDERRFLDGFVEDVAASPAAAGGAPRGRTI